MDREKEVPTWSISILAKIFCHNKISADIIKSLKLKFKPGQSITDIIKLKEQIHQQRGKLHSVQFTKIIEDVLVNIVEPDEDNL